MLIPQDYSYVMASALAITMHYAIQAGPVSAKRKKIFPVEFLRKEFGIVHEAQLGEPIEAGGYPDTGNGFYSQKLSYKDWYEFNVLQRVHLNYLENMPVALMSLLCSGVYRPRQAAILGLVYLLGRIISSTFYKKKGGAANKLRIAGSALGYLSILTNVGIFAYHVIKAWAK